MVVQQAYLAVRNALREADIEDAAWEADALLRMATGKGHLEQDPQRAMDEEEQERLDALTQRRCARYPLQYLAGRWPFYGIELAVGEGVLIPRPDTETVVEQALSMLRGVPSPRVLDLCAGSGAIGLAIKQMRPDAVLTLVERSDAALRYCRENAAGRGQVVQADLFGYEKTLAPQSFDCIVCNPPYVTLQEYETLEPELAFEPREALVAAEEGLAFYRYLAEHYRAPLAAGGALVLEIGATQRAAVERFLGQNGWEGIGAAQDLGGKDRCVFARRPAEKG